MTEIPNDPVVTLLKNPNWFQGEKEFLRQTKLFHEIFGNEVIWLLNGTGLNNLKTKAIYTLPPNMIECDYDEESTPFFMNATRPKTGVTYKFVKGIQKTDLPLDNIIHFNDNRVNITDETIKRMLWGQSKMKGLTPAINNLRLAYETRGVILKRRGALGILSNQSADVTGHIPVGQKEKDELQKQYKNYGGLEDQDQLIISEANLKWQQMAVSPDKLGLFQECETDTYKICDGYGVPQELLASSKGTTYENQNEARKNFYDNTIIPEANEWIGGIQKAFYPNAEVILMMDYSHLSFYQEDIELNARALGNLVTGLSQAFADGAISLQDYQSELNKIGLAVGNQQQ